MNHVAHVCRLRGRITVVELQNNRIPFAALDARMLFQKSHNKRARGVSLEWVTSPVALRIRCFVVDVVASRRFAATHSAF